MTPEYAVLIIFIADVRHAMRPHGEVLVGSIEPVGGIKWEPDGSCSIVAKNDELWDIIAAKTDELEKLGIQGPAFCQQFSTEAKYQGKNLGAMPPHQLHKLEEALGREELVFGEE